ncbi:Hypothetical predicted protein [Olea europaea subsp. europaea]|uniref:Uncharacterized protein n=1 Tax=Olea europaea subsp. europaea TaxID=158383 RepID=A0A8S0V1C3_OLEEU|nr:Hypothetical predicted protein [Olea europaea subsp. europaea]
MNQIEKEKGINDFQLLTNRPFSNRRLPTILPRISTTTTNTPVLSSHFLSIVQIRSDVRTVVRES